MKIKVDEAKCIGCGTCVSLCPDCFEMVGSVSHPKKSGNCDATTCNLEEVAASCPVEAITVEKEKTEGTEKPKEEKSE